MSRHQRNHRRHDSCGRRSALGRRAFQRWRKPKHSPTVTDLTSARDCASGKRSVIRARGRATFRPERGRCWRLLLRLQEREHILLVPSITLFGGWSLNVVVQSWRRCTKHLAWPTAAHRHRYVRGRRAWHVSAGRGSSRRADNYGSEAEGAQPLGAVRQDEAGRANLQGDVLSAGSPAALVGRLKPEPQEGHTFHDAAVGFKSALHRYTRQET